MALGSLIGDDGANDPAPSTSPDQLRDILRARGWSEADIDAYFAGTGGSPIYAADDPSVANPGAIDVPTGATDPRRLPDGTFVPGPDPGAGKIAAPGSGDAGAGRIVASGSSGSGDAGGYGAFAGGDNPFGPWTGHFTAPPVQGLPDVPEFVAPEYTKAPAFDWASTHPAPVYTKPGEFSYADFAGPTIEEAINSPGYQFRLQQGTDRLQNAASARGTLNDSGTLKALIDYGQDAASQEYGNVWDRGIKTYTTNRGNAFDNYVENVKTQFDDPYTAAVKAWETGSGQALDAYKTNVTTQYTDPYNASYKAAQDAYAPKLAGWQANAQNIAHLNDVTNTNAWQDYLLGWQDYEARRTLGANFALQS